MDSKVEITSILIKHSHTCYQPHHQRPKHPTDYIVVNGNLTSPKIGTVRICYDTVVDGGPITTIAVQSPITATNNFRPFDYTGNDYTGVKWWETEPQVWVEPLPAFSTSFQSQYITGKENNKIAAAVHRNNPEGNSDKTKTNGTTVKYTFRPFTEDDAHRTLSWGICGRNNENHHRNNPLRFISSLFCCRTDCGPSCPMIQKWIGTIIGTEVTLLEERFASKADMFKDKLQEFHWKVILVRSSAYLLLSLAFFLILKPIATLLSFVPFIGYAMIHFFWLVSLIAGTAIGICISGAAWVLHRPWVLTGQL